MLINAKSATPDLVQIGLAHHQAGRLAQAYDAYQQALIENPQHADALHLLGMIAHQIGDQALAVELINRAISINSNLPNYYSNLGNVLQAQGKPDEAITAFRLALAIEPNNVVFHFNLGHALQELGKLQAAAESYRAALALAPQHIESLSNLGHTLLSLGMPEQAVECYRQAVTVAPNFAEMHFNLGAALNALGKFDEASASYQRAITISPDYVQAHCNLGSVLMTLKRFDDAAHCFQRAISINPDFSEAHYNLGIALQAQDKLDAAIASYRRTLEIQPNFVEGYCNLGNALRAQGRLNEALDCYRKALAIKPDYANAYSNLLFLKSYHNETSPAEYLSLARGWECACIPLQIRQAARSKQFARLPISGRRLKIGYVSGDFRKHSVSYFIEQIISRHDRSKTEIFAYSNNRYRDAITARLNELADHWIPIVAMSDEQACEQIEADNIDVLIDLSAHSAHNRLGVFARRAAPVQASYLYFASTGLTEMDYWIGDEVLTPPELDGHFSERVWRLPRTWLSYKTISEAPMPNWHNGLGNSVSPAPNTIWLGCFNNLGKVTPHTLALWAQILLALPEAMLLLKNKELADPGNQLRILAELSELGIQAERIDLQPGSGWADYMAQHDRLDIALDPIGSHGGGTSTCDALWMGVPVIHLLGEHVGARFAASLLSAIGHSEWIAHSEKEYVDKVIDLARNVEQRKQLRFTLRNDMALSPLCDAQGLAHALEDAYTSMFARWYDTQSTISQP